MVSITRHIEFDAGHRVPSHQSKCKNAHGHRYKMDVTVTGPILEERGQSDDGMIADFGDIKRVLERVVSAYDHAFIVCTRDIKMVEALKCLGEDHKTMHVSVIPTVENLVKLLAVSIDLELCELRPLELKLTKIVLWETPNSWAEWVRDTDS